MSGLEVAASVIAVISLSAKVASLCHQYSTDVKNANKDIERLQAETSHLKTALESVQKLLEDSDGSALSASNKLRDALDDCSSQLTKLEKKLDPGKTRHMISRIGIRLTWPFSGKDVEKIVMSIRTSRDAISLALQVDQT